MISNPYGLPDAYVNAVSKQRIPQPKRISVTELLQPPRLRALWLQHFNEIELVAGDNDHDLFHGNAIHAYLAAHAGTSAVVEHQMAYRFGEWTVHGTPDHLDWLAFGEPGQLIDWKSTKVRALKYDKPEWETQVNFYAHLLRLNGYEVDRVTVWAFLKDWDRSKVTEPDYPRSHACQMDFPLWDAAVVDKRMQDRLAAHINAQYDALPDCTDEERWMRPTWAVWPKKGDAQRASRVFGDKPAAVEWAKANTPELGLWERWWEIERRPGTPLRCASWCPVREWCDQAEAESR